MHALVRGWDFCYNFVIGFAVKFFFIGCNTFIELADMIFTTTAVENTFVIDFADMIFTSIEVVNSSSASQTSSLSLGAINMMTSSSSSFVFLAGYIY